jgi:hypothetical protein
VALNIRQKIAAAFGALMLTVVVLMTPWAEEVAGEQVVLLGAWAPLWDPPSPTAVIDMLRLAAEGACVLAVTSISLWMLRD